MIVSYEIDLTQPIPDDVIERAKKLKDRQIVFDEDCPELTEEQIENALRARRCERVAVG